jgi:hypothetical protein
MKLLKTFTISETSFARERDMVARFFKERDTKTRKNVPNGTQNVPNGHKISQISQIST